MRTESNNYRKLSLFSDFSFKEKHLFRTQRINEIVYESENKQRFGSVERCIHSKWEIPSFNRFEFTFFHFKCLYWNQINWNALDNSESISESKFRTSNWQTHITNEKFLWNKINEMDMWMTIFDRKSKFYFFDYQSNGIEWIIHKHIYS